MFETFDIQCQPDSSQLTGVLPSGPSTYIDPGNAYRWLYDLRAISGIHDGHDVLPFTITICRPSWELGKGAVCTNRTLGVTSQE